VGDLATRGGEGDPRNYWIMKPTSSSRGRGIYLVDNLGDVTYGEPMVVQRYLSAPLLVDGFKFDLR
jgi:tubulin polyglutamylase TTLL2